MYVNEIQIRVRYAETDQMGYVYYGHYATYFEVARVEMLRSLGFSYKILEAEGILLPVLNFSIKYNRPAFYDDLLKIKTEIRTFPTASIRFDYKTFNEKEELLNIAETTLVFVNKNSGRPGRPPRPCRPRRRRPREAVDSIRFSYNFPAANPTGIATPRPSGARQPSAQPIKWQRPS